MGLGVIIKGWRIFHDYEMKELEQPSIIFPFVPFAGFWTLMDEHGGGHVLHRFGLGIWSALILPTYQPIRGSH